MPYAIWVIWVAGATLFFALLALGLEKKGWDLSKLERGEVRKVITITFTLVYLLLLPYYFFNAVMPAAENATGPIENSNITSPNSQIQTYNVTANMVPVEAINDIFKNFLYIYLFIIIFYFTSRSVDNYSEAKRITALKDADPLKIAETQYARGKIDIKKFEEIKKKLKNE